MSEIAAMTLSETVYRDVEAHLPSPTSAWPIDRALARLLARIVIERDLRNLLEFGAGSSSIVFAKALQYLGGGRLTSVEEEPAWSAAEWAIASNARGVDARLIHSSVAFRAAPFGLYHSYSEAADAALAARGPYALVLIDAPDGYIGRDGALHLALPYLAPGALIVIDDARRPKERDAIARWLAIYPGLRVLAEAPSLRHGAVVLEYNGDPTRRISTRAFLSSIVREAYAWTRKHPISTVRRAKGS